MAERFCDAGKQQFLNLKRVAYANIETITVCAVMTDPLPLWGKEALNREGYKTYIISMFVFHVNFLNMKAQKHVSVFIFYLVPTIWDIISSLRLYSETVLLPSMGA